MDAPRFNAFAKPLAVAASRRGLLKLVAALGLGGALGSRSGRHAVAAKLPTFPGVAGGGRVATDYGPADFALLATRLEVDDEEVVVGRLRWVAPDWQGRELILDTETITAYGPVAGIEGGREVRGTVRLGGAAELPFVLNVAAGAPGSATVRLEVGDVRGVGTPGALGYVVDGPLEAGDLVLVGTGPEDATPTG